MSQKADLHLSIGKSPSGEVFTNVSTAAKAAGMSRQGLAAAIKAGRVTPRSDGSFSREELLAQLAAKTDPTKNRGRRAAQIVEATPSGDADAAVSYDEIRRKLESGEPMDFMEARTANEVLKARQAAIKLDEMSGLLVSKAEYKAMREAENQAIKDRMRSVPMSIAERVADLIVKGGKAPEVQALMLAEIDAALEDASMIEAEIAA